MSQVKPDDIVDPHSQFAAAADDVFATNPRVVQQEMLGQI